MPSNKDTDPHIEREPPNWWIFPIALLVVIAIFATYRFSCTKY